MRFILLLAIAGAAFAQESARESIDGVVDKVAEKARKTFDVPGIAVAVVKDGQVVFAKGFGVRKMGDAAPVTANTLFGIASNTKAFTAASIAMLVDQGKVHWTDRVIDYLPAFQMADPYVTREMRVKDLLVHRSGLALGAGDLMFFPASDLSSDEIVKRLRYVPLATSFRSAYAYDNVLYLVAGKLIEAVSGKPWAAFIKERIFSPLGMSASKTSITDIKPGDDFASPHAHVDGVLAPIRPDVLDNNAPAGAIQSSVAEMSKWIAMQLNIGELPDGTRLFSAAQSKEMWSEVTPIPINDPPPQFGALKMNFSSYALGWSVNDYRGYKLVWHTGGLSGMVSRVTMVPDLKLGVVVLTNQEMGAAFSSITMTILDQYMKAPPMDWIATYDTVGKLREAGVADILKKDALKRNKSSKPSLALSSYAGRYRDPWYGDVTIKEEGGKLIMRFTHSPDLTGEMEHWQYDTFIARWKNRAMNADAYVTFSLKPDGSVDQIKMAAVSPLTDFSFDFHHLALKPIGDLAAY
ncbi:MAG TPA: serine hydrolase [Bryobacteraceae bacterium]|jgi:CubicO group peptidase (beta-lactamase class C family)|nr:serine hydrolase [Bryobacteraceae bacterium]